MNDLWLMCIGESNWYRWGEVDKYEEDGTGN